MNIPQISKNFIASAKVIGSILGTLSVLIGVVFLLEDRYAHAERTEAEFAELQTAMDDSKSTLQLDVQQMYLNLKTEINDATLKNLEQKERQDNGLNIEDRQRYQRLKEQNRQYEQKLERLEQFRLEHQM